MHYRIFGLNVRSHLPLQEVHGAEPRDEVDVVIKTGKLEPLPLESVYNGRSFRGTADSAHLFWEHVGTFSIRKGREIIVDPVPEVPESILTSFVTGAVMGLLLHQRGYFVLHASAVSIDGGVIAFLGFKGGGKSTMAAMLYARGHPVVTDDVLAVEITQTDALVVPSGYRWLKLWPEAVTAALAENPEHLPRLHPDFDKRIKSVSPGSEQAVLPLKCIYVLDAGPKLAIERIQGRAAFMQLMHHAYAPRFTGKAGVTPLQFEQCAKLAREVPIFNLKREQDLSLLPNIADLVESHAAYDTRRTPA